MMTPQVDRPVEVPMNKIILLECVGFVSDTGSILEDELEGGRRTSLDKIDNYFYEIITSLLRNNGRPQVLPFK
jgi:hypothetical protein